MTCVSFLQNNNANIRFITIGYHLYVKQLYFVNPGENVAMLVLANLNALKSIAEGKKGRLQAVFDLSISPQWMRDISACETAKGGCTRAKS